MAYIQYYQNNFCLSLKKATSQTTNFIIPLNTDTLFLLQSNNQYQIYRIRSNQIVGTGQIPKGFVASQYIKPLTNFTQECIYFYSNQASICKLNYKQNTVEIHQMVLPEKVNSFNSIALEYRLLDQFGLYLAGWLKNTQNLSCTFFIYEWNSKIFSNSIHLGSTFFNLKISNFHQQQSFPHDKMQVKQRQKNFIVIAQEDKKICYNYLQLSIKQNATQSDLPTIQKKRFQIILRQSGKKVINLPTDQIVMMGYLKYPEIYAVTNNRQGPSLHMINMESNSSRKFQLGLIDSSKKVVASSSMNKQKGIIRKYLGIVDGNMLFTVHFICAKSQQIYALPFSQLLKIQPNITKIYANKLLVIQNEGDQLNKTKIADVVRSIDGYSLIKYNFQYEKITKLCLKQNAQFQPKLQLQVIYRIPKKYFYSQMAQRLQFSSALTYQVLRLL